MPLTALAVTRPVGTSIVFLALLVLGLVSFHRLPVDLMPSVDMPRISVTTAWEGVAPAEVEALVTRPVEQAVSTIQGVRRLEASSSEGLSRVTLNFEWGSDLDTAMADVRANLDRVTARLPEDADRPLVFKFDLSAYPVAKLSVAGEGDPRRLRILADEVLSRRLEAVPGVAAIHVMGGLVREVQVRLSPVALFDLGVSPADVVAALAAENRNVSAGDLLAAGREVVVRTEGEFEDPSEVGSVVVSTRGGRAVTVRELGQVADTWRDPNAELWIDGTPGIQLRVAKQDGENTVEVARAVRAEVEAINRDLAGIVRVGFIEDGSTFIQQAIDNVTRAAIGGSLLAVAVLWAFLRNLRATLVVATTIPLSVVSTFSLMEAAGMSLNLVSFGGLALGIGMLVDNAIVLLESVVRRREEGQEPIAAAIEGAEEVSLAITASTLTTLAVFVPVVFIGGFAGVLFREMAVVVSFSLLCSLFVALTLVPALAARMLSGGGSLGAAGHFERPYQSLLARALRRRGRVVGGGLLAVAVSVALFRGVPYELMPESDEGLLGVEVDLPVGTPLATTGATVRAMEAAVREVVRPEELRTVLTFAGPDSWWHPAGGNEGSLEVYLVPVSERSRGVAVLSRAVQAALADFAGAEVRVRPRSSNMLNRILRRGSDDRLSIVIRGHDQEVATATGERIAAALRELVGVTFARIDREQPKLERVVRIDRDRVAELGLRGADVARAVGAFVDGTVATRFREGSGEYDVRVRLADTTHLDRLLELPVVGAGGASVPLAAVARVEEAQSPTSIVREDQERVMRVSAGTAGRALGDVVADVRVALAGIAVPDGFSVAVGGEVAEQEAAFGELWLGLALAVFLTFAVMAVQFESLRDPLVVMVAVPFGFVGVALVLRLTGTPFSMNAFLGTIALVGIVVNNAIVLVDAANRRRALGLEPEAAVIDAAGRRLRPILMTTLTTVLGMIPLALGSGEGAEVQAPLARVIIGGLTVSTAVTLVIVPVLYLGVRRVSRRG